MNFKTGILMMLVGIAILGTTTSSVSAAQACCYVDPGTSQCKQGTGNIATCYGSGICGYYDGFVWGQTGNGGYYSNNNLDCWANAELLKVASYYNYYTTQKTCYY